jgi:putative hydrolase of the HAD superfamily
MRIDVKQDFLNRLENARGIVWDLDNTLYRLDDAMADAFHLAIARAVTQEGGVDLDLDEAFRMARKSFADHGYSGSIFVRSYGVDDEWLHHTFHTYVDEKVIARSLETVDLFARLGLRHALITHGSGKWARRVLAHLGLNAFFEDGGILALEDYGFQKKSESAVPFMRALDHLKLPPEQALIVEDTVRNLAIPYELDMGTVLVHYGRKPDPAPPFVDADYDNTLDFLRHMMQQRKVPVK